MKTIYAKIKKTKTFKYVLLIGLVVFTISCKDVTNKLVGVEPEAVDTLVITMIAKSSANPVFLPAKTGAIKKAEDISKKYSLLDVVINWRTPEN